MRTDDDDWIVRPGSGWHLSQDAQARFTWTTPADLTYREEPHQYAI